MNKVRLLAVVMGLHVCAAYAVEPDLPLELNSRELLFGGDRIKDWGDGAKAGVEGAVQMTPILLAALVSGWVGGRTINNAEKYLRAEASYADAKARYEYESKTLGRLTGELNGYMVIDKDKQGNTFVMKRKMKTMPPAINEQIANAKQMANRLNVSRVEMDAAEKALPLAKKNFFDSKEYVTARSKINTALNLDPETPLSERQVEAMSHAPSTLTKVSKKLLWVWLAQGIASGVKVAVTGKSPGSVPGINFRDGDAANATAAEEAKRLHDIQAQDEQVLKDAEWVK